MDVLVKIANALDTTVDVFLTGVQLKDIGNYENEIADLMKGRYPYEKRIIYETVSALISALEANKRLIEDEVLNSIQDSWR